MTACASVCVRVKCSLTLSICLSNELALQQNVRQDRSFKRKETCSACARCVELWLIECVRSKVRDTDSDYVMRKPSRCRLGAVPRYWNVVASRFHFISFAVTTSATLAPGVGISQPILLLFFFVFLLLNLSTKRCLRFFFIRSQNLVAFKRRQDWLKNRLFSNVSNYLTNFRFKFWTFEATFAKGHEE